MKSALGNGGWLLGLILSLLATMIMGLALVWLSIDRNDIAYSIRQRKQDVEAAKEHLVKLEVERDSLLSPYELGKKAAQLGMSMADPGQVRRLDVAALKEQAKLEALAAQKKKGGRQ